jgi:plastocyanin
MPQTYPVDIQNMKFQPDPVNVAAGDSVQWTNRDDSDHTVTADDGSFDSGAMEQGDTFTQTFSAAASIKYHCEFHAGMKGTVIVS